MESFGRSFPCKGITSFWVALTLRSMLPKNASVNPPFAMNKTALGRAWHDSIAGLTQPAAITKQLERFARPKKMVLRAHKLTVLLSKFACGLKRA